MLTEGGSTRTPSFTAARQMERRGRGRRGEVDREAAGSGSGEHTAVARGIRSPLTSPSPPPVGDRRCRCLPSRQIWQRGGQCYRRFARERGTMRERERERRKRERSDETERERLISSPHAILPYLLLGGSTHGSVFKRCRFLKKPTPRSFYITGTYNHLKPPVFCVFSPWRWEKIYRCRF